MAFEKIFENLSFSNLFLIFGGYYLVKVNGPNTKRKELNTMKKIIAIILAAITALTFSATAFAAPFGSIEKEEAKAIVLEHAGFTAEEVTFTEVKLDYENHGFEYDIEFFADGVEYDYTVAASDGRIISFEIDNKKPAAPDGIITADEAKAIALKHAGVTENEVRFIKAELDNDDGRYEYDIEFVANGMEYDYTVSATDGKILDYDKKVEDAHFTLSFLIDFFKSLFSVIFG